MNRISRCDWVPERARRSLIILLAPRAGKMNRISRCDWLPSGQDGAILPARDTGYVPQGTFIMLWCFIPYNKSFFDQACSVKVAGYWPRSFFACLWTSTSSRSINIKISTLGIGASSVKKVSLVIFFLGRKRSERPRDLFWMSSEWADEF